MKRSALYIALLSLVLAALLWTAGLVAVTHVVRLVRGAKVMAEGEFVLVQ
jgi:hypothetical protein